MLFSKLLSVLAWFVALHACIRNCAISMYDFWEVFLVPRPSFFLLLHVIVHAKK